MSYSGEFYQVEDLVLEPKPDGSAVRPRPPIYAGGESEAARTMIARHADAYVMHGDPPERIAARVGDMCRRRNEAADQLQRDLPPLRFGMAAYAVMRDTAAEAAAEVARITAVPPGSPGYANYQDWIGNTRLEQRVTLEDYSVSNRGLRAGLVGTPEQVAGQIERFVDAGVDLLLLQCSPQLEEMERFAAAVITPRPAPDRPSRAGRQR